MKRKKIIKDIGLSYIEIYWCVNDCMLFWNYNHTLDSSKGAMSLGRRMINIMETLRERETAEGYQQTYCVMSL